MAPAQGWHAKSWSVPHFWSRTNPLDLIFNLYFYDIITILEQFMKICFTKQSSTAAFVRNCRPRPDPLVSVSKTFLVLSEDACVLHWHYPALNKRLCRYAEDYLGACVNTLTLFSRGIILNYTIFKHKDILQIHSKLVPHHVVIGNILHWTPETLSLIAKTEQSSTF